MLLQTTGKYFTMRFAEMETLTQEASNLRNSFLLRSSENQLSRWSKIWKCMRTVQRRQNRGKSQVLVIRAEALEKRNSVRLVGEELRHVDTGFGLRGAAVRALWCWNQRLRDGSGFRNESNSRLLLSAKSKSDERKEIGRLFLILYWLWLGNGSKAIDYCNWRWLNK